MAVTQLARESRDSAAPAVHWAQGGEHDFSGKPRINPVKHRLVLEPEQWLWSSLR